MVLSASYTNAQLLHKLHFTQNQTAQLGPPAHSKFSADGSFHNKPCAL